MMPAHAPNASRFAPGKIAALALLIASTGVCRPAAAQNVTLRGRAVDPDGRPVASLEVLMHRVADGAGANVARDTTDESGAFTLTAPAEAGDSAVYFAAARFRNELFVGPFVRAPVDASEYVLEVGGQPFSMDVSPAGASPTVAPPADPAGRWFLAVPLLALAAVAAFIAWRGTQPDPERRLLLRIASLDEDDSGADRSRERERIVERLLTR